MPDRQSIEGLRAREAHEGAGRHHDRRATGGTIGGTLGLLAGIGALAIPGLGPFIAAGPIMAALGGVGSAAAVGGWLARWSGWAFPNTKPSATRVA